MPQFCWLNVKLGLGAKLIFSQPGLIHQFCDLNHLWSVGFVLLPVDISLLTFYLGSPPWMLHCVVLQSHLTIWVNQGGRVKRWNWTVLFWIHSLYLSFMMKTLTQTITRIKLTNKMKKQKNLQNDLKHRFLLFFLI